MAQTVETSHGPGQVRLTIQSVSAFRRALPMRMPFQFGDVTLRSLEVAYVRVQIEQTGPRGTLIPATGWSSSILSPAWFDKSAASYETKAERLRIGMAHAAAQAVDRDAASAYQLHEAVQPQVTKLCAGAGIPPLTASFGVALIDGAVVDALCRTTGSTLHQGLSQDLFGFGDLPDLPTAPSPRLEVRHTIGLRDPLTQGDLTQRLTDGLPETLDEVIAAYGVRWFKVKIDADLDRNLARLREIQAILQTHAAEDCQLVMDGNEQFSTMDQFAAFVDAYRGDPKLGNLCARTRWYEQPVTRDRAFDADVRTALQHLGDAQPVIADESDGQDDAVTEALAAGYGGVSAKNCKGIFRTLHSYRELHRHRRAGRGPGILSGEDLTHPGIRALNQDNAVVCALGIPHAERNGHHYVRGLAALPASEQEIAATTFGDLYHRREEGLLSLAIRDGFIQTESCNQLAYGGPIEMQIDTLEPIDLSIRPSGPLDTGGGPTG